MADNIDALLRSGERVLYGGEWSLWFLLPRRWPQAAATLFLLFGLFDAYGLLGSDWPGLTAGLCILLFLGVPSLKSYLKEAGSEAAVTEARAIVTTEWEDVEITEVAACDVARIALFPGAARVTTKAGQTVVLSPPHRAREIAMALAHAAGATPPGPPGLKHIVVEHVLAVGRIAGGLAAAVAVLQGLSAAAGVPLSQVDTAVAALAAFFTGRALARLAGLCLFRPLLTHAEMRDWIRHSDLFSTDPIAPAEANWLARWHLRFADRLYGQAAAPAGRLAQDAKAPLEDRLAPGERVLYRAPPCWEPSDWLEDLLISVGCLGVAALLRIVTFDEAGLVALAAALAPLCLHTLWSYVQGWSIEALVSERRLLHRSGWFARKVVEVDAAAVAGVTAHQNRFRITKRDGEIVDLGHPQNAWGLGVALAHAAAAPPPRLPTRKELIGDRVFTGIGVFSVVAMPVLLLKWLFVSFATAVVLFSAVGFLCLFLGAALLAILAGMVLSGLITLAVLRPFFSHREIRDWLHHGILFWPDPGSGAEEDWWRKFHRRFAERLYGRPIRTEPRHGA